MRPVRWGILGAASIARAQFLPGLRDTGDGVAAIVASRDRERGERFASEQGIQRTADSYEAVLAAEIDAVYVPLPNSEHARWTIAALQAGLPVLCEKPLCAQPADTERVIASAREHPSAPLWEAFVFPFHDQHRRLLELLRDGAIGEPSQLDSAFHFLMAAADDDIRLSAALGGGALADVGCYPIRLAHELFGPAGDVGTTAKVEGEVEVEAAGYVEHGARRLLLSCGFRRPYDTFTRVLGDAGEIRLSNPFHPQPYDVLELRRPGSEPVLERPTSDAHSFTAALKHIHAVIREREQPRQLAIDSAVATARTLAALQAQISR